MNEVKKYWDFGFPLVAVLLSLVATIEGFSYGIDTLYDEGSHCLDMMSSLYSNIPGDDRTWWSDIFLAIFGKDICSSVLSLRVIKLVIALLTSIIFWLLTQDIAATWHEKIAYLTVLLMAAAPTMGGIMVCYNSFSQFLLILACGVIYRLCKSEKQTTIGGYAVVLGCLLTFSMFSIVVSGFVISVVMLILVIIRYWKRWKEVAIVFGMMAVGGTLTLLWIHLFAINLKDVWYDVLGTAQTITNVNRGYDPITMVTKMVLFCRDMSFCALMVIGAIYVSKRIAEIVRPLVGGVFFIIILISYAYYQKKPELTTSMLLSMLWILPLLQREKNMELKQFFQFENLFSLFLLLFPLMAVLGTNVYIGSKMVWFMLPWVFLSWKCGFAKSNKMLRTAVLIVLSLSLIRPSIYKLKDIDPSREVVKFGMFKGMHMTHAQAEHLAKVDSIVNQYNFHRGESIFFTTQLSMATCCLLDAVPCGFYFQPMDFVAHANDSMPIPDFLFICKYDEDIAGKTLQNMPWGWPEEFDKYYVGSPDALNVGYPTERWLYCRKK